MKRFFKDLLVTLTISAIVLGAGLSLIEKYYHVQLDKAGWLPKNKNSYLYERRLSGYTVRENTPNYILSSYDDHFKPAPERTDSNGFLTGGAAIRKEKPAGTVRIFIVGGSAAWGTIENRDIMHDTTYPAGTYCYASTIAGKLSALLANKYHSPVHFEVIDAAVVGFRLHQNFALYYERLHDFKPDIIINFDGYNDMSNFMAFQGGDPYSNVSDQLEEELQLATMARLPQWPYALAYYNYKYIREHGEQAAFNVPPQGIVMSNDQRVIDHEVSLDAYNQLKPYLHISDKMLWLVASYERQLKADSVLSIFCLQPTLRRRVYQKELGPTESKFRTIVEKVTIADTINTTAFVKSDSTLSALYRVLYPKVHSEIFWITDMMSAYMFNDLSPVLDSIVTSNGGVYLDINKSITGLKSDKEFYVDYCHLTPYGNEFIAELLMDKVDDFMKERLKKHL